MKRVILGFAAALALGACQTSDTSDTAQKEPDPRQGAEVRQVCFTSQIRSWKANDRRSVIVEKRRNEEYMLELAGACEPQDAFTSIGLVSRVGGGNCLTSGDRLVTDSRYDGGPCTIMNIYEWHADAGKADAPEEK
ncbi:MAG: DUF6491 family protein [Hyphomonadaceae bacterium]